MDEKKTVDDLERLFAAGDAWLRRFGQVTSIAHNSIVLNLYAAFPKVRYVDYFLPRDPNVRKVWVNLYVPFWKLVFLNRDKMADQVIDFLQDYLHDYDIWVTLKRYKRGVEKDHGVPKEAASYLLPDGYSDLLREPGSPEDSPGASAEPDKPGDPKAGSGGLPG